MLTIKYSIFMFKKRLPKFLNTLRWDISCWRQFNITRMSLFFQRATVLFLSFTLVGMGYVRGIVLIDTLRLIFRLIITCNNPVFLPISLYSIITPFDAFEISCIWKYYGKWRIFGLSSIERKWFFLWHRLSAKPAHQMSATSVFTHLYNSFVMGLPVVNTSLGRQYQLVCTIKYSTINGSYLVIWLSF